jgi:hypothetical protein
MAWGINDTVIVFGALAIVLGSAASLAQNAYIANVGDALDHQADDQHSGARVHGEIEDRDRRDVRPIGSGNKQSPG